MPFTDRFNRRADMLAVTVTEFTAEGTADVFVIEGIALWAQSFRKRCTGASRIVNSPS